MKHLIIILLLAGSAFATCSITSGINWTCTNGSTQAQVQSAINSAADGAVITFQPGSYNSTPGSGVGYTFSNTKGVTLICATPPLANGAATVNSCTITGNSYAMMGGESFTGTNTHFYRISGFILNNAGQGGNIIWFNNANGSGLLTMFGPNGLGGIRIDHNTFQSSNGGTVAVFFGWNNGDAQYAGVIDHNTITGSTQYSGFFFVGTTPNSSPTWQTGTANNMFVEDNILSFTNMPASSNGGCTDSQGNGSWVVRHNTSTNCLWTTHGVTHSGGPQNYELYNNTISLDAGATWGGASGCYRCFHHQGSGTTLAFNNSFTAPGTKDGEVMSMLHYRDYSGSIDGALPYCDGTQGIDGNRAPTTTYRGYPCWHQPGRAMNGTYKPNYYWNNRYKDNSRVPMVTSDGAFASPDYYANHMQANRDWFEEATPFTGAAGTGFGPLASRPATCTTSSEAAFGGQAGVGYFATDAGPQGTLYTCSATNTWTAYYQPYTYPHPLVGGAPPPTPPNAPTNAIATVDAPPTLTLDMIDWMTMDPDLAATSFMSGTSTPIYTVMDAANSRFWWIKNAAGSPWDVKNYDANLIYDKYTEQIFSDPHSYKDHAPGGLGYPWAHRFVTYNPRTPGIKIDEIDTFPANFDVYNNASACGGITSSSNLGHVKTELWGPFTESLGGSLPNNLTTFHLNWLWSCDASYNNCATKETFTLSQRYGQIRWQNYSLVSGVYQLQQDVLKNTVSAGTTTPVHPCFP